MLPTIPESSQSASTVAVPALAMRPSARPAALPKLPPSLPPRSEPPPRASRSRSRANVRGRYHVQINDWISRGRRQDAPFALECLQKLDWREARWPHKRGDVLRSLGRLDGAIEAYAQAARRYHDSMRPRQGAAMLSLARELSLSWPIRG